MTPSTQTISSDAGSIAADHSWRWQDFLELTKPKVTLLIVFTAMVGMVLASPGMVPWSALLFGTIGIALASGSAASFNHVLDRDIDGKMTRTRRRPLPTRHLLNWQAVVFASVLGVMSMAVLWSGVGILTAALALASLIGYAMIYTVWLSVRRHRISLSVGLRGPRPRWLGGRR